METDELDLNLELRQRILEPALRVEYYTNFLLKIYLSIDIGKDSKSFGNRSSNLPFSSKLILLNDLEILTTEETKPFNLLMEIRNKFMHVYECNSILKACDLAANKNKLLKYYKRDVNDINDGSNVLSDEEHVLQIAYQKLHDHIITILIEKITQRTNHMRYKKMYLDTISSQAITLTNALNNIFKETAELITTEEKTSPDYRLFRSSIIEILTRNQVGSDFLDDLSNKLSFFGEINIEEMIIRK